MKFNDWFTTRLIVNKFPLPSEILKAHYDYIINVSDEYSGECHDTAMERGIKYFWFPMNERVGDMGLNSLYAALKIIWQVEQEGASVLLHCHAGVNRSPTVRDAYYFLRTKKHREEIVFDEEIEERLTEWLNLGKSINGKNNMLLENIRKGHLPSINKMESFLRHCEVQFKKEETDNSGGLDKCKGNAGI